MAPAQLRQLQLLHGLFKRVPEEGIARAVKEELQKSMATWQPSMPSAVRAQAGTHGGGVSGGGRHQHRCEGSEQHGGHGHLLGDLRRGVQGRQGE